jgi:hypothetical protein
MTRPNRMRLAPVRRMEASKGLICQEPTSGDASPAGVTRCEAVHVRDRHLSIDNGEMPDPEMEAKRSPESPMACTSHSKVYAFACGVTLRVEMCAAGGVVGGSAIAGS